MNIVCNPFFVTRSYPSPEDDASCFVIMPFSGELIQEVYTEYTKPTIEEVGLKCIRGDDIFSVCSIMEDIFGAICKANVIIAEFTGRNPNVLYEAGIAHTLGKPLIGITQDMEDVPFDLRSIRHITYKPTPKGLIHLKETLRNTLKSVMKQQHEMYPQMFSDDEEAYQQLLEAYVRRNAETDRMYSLIEARILDKYEQYNQKIRELSPHGSRKLTLKEIGICFVKVDAEFIDVDYFDDDMNAQINIDRKRVDAFCISKAPITNQQYAVFVQETGHPYPDDWNGSGYRQGQGDHPVTGVSWVDITMFCRWMSEILGCEVSIPSEAQWLAAAGYGINKQRYPWGAKWIDGACNSKEYDHGKRKIMPVNYFDKNVSPCGCVDMLGNVWEWTDSPYDIEKENGFQWRAVRGGANYTNLKDIGVLARLVAHPGHFLFVRDLGFRVVTDRCL